MHKSKLKEGMEVISDSGFTCLKEGDVRTVKVDEEGYFYINCEEGTHLLIGQYNEDGIVVGLNPYEEGS